MLKKTIIGFMLALFAGPLSAHAEMPGQPCTAAQIGTTKMADDKQNIIACLLTGKTAPENVQEWKDMANTDKNISYSLTCEDWKDSGFSSKDACIKDGRWHLVYINDDNGKTTFGSLKEFKSYTDQGADVKNNDYNGDSHICQTVVWKGNLVHCLDGVRVQGEVWRNDLKYNDNKIGLGAVARRSDGVRVSSNVVPRSNGDLEFAVFPTPGMAFKWFVRF
ncbi:MAG: hypothetical protein IPI58_05070 [Alphaproteobacteria bacterium]|nr:MAG: hypothetical protein IPI58_05070 [Alphaproteobacteria bacterium]